jgi:hypothetical protein
VARKTSLKENLIENRFISNQPSVLFSTTHPIGDDLPSEPVRASGGLILRRISSLNKPHHHPVFLQF